MCGGRALVMGVVHHPAGYTHLLSMYRCMPMGHQVAYGSQGSPTSVWAHVITPMSGCWVLLMAGNPGMRPQDRPLLTAPVFGSEVSPHST